MKPSKHLNRIVTILKEATKPLTVGDVVAFQNELPNQEIRLGYKYTQQIISKLQKKGYLKKYTGKHQPSYSYKHDNKDGIPEVLRSIQLSEKDNPDYVDWKEGLSIAGPIIKTWEPYIPPKDEPPRPDSLNHLKWKSYGTP